MKNPFIQMAVLAAAARSAFAEMHFGDIVDPHARKTRDRTPGERRPAGSKLARMASEKRIGLCHAGLNPHAKKAKPRQSTAAEVKRFLSRRSDQYRPAYAIVDELAK